MAAIHRRRLAFRVAPRQPAPPRGNRLADDAADRIRAGLPALAEARP